LQHKPRQIEVSREGDFEIRFRVVEQCNGNTKLLNCGNLVRDDLIPTQNYAVGMLQDSRQKDLRGLHCPKAITIHAPSDKSLTRGAL
jgi:hypothetical protein